MARAAAQTTMSDGSAGPFRGGGRRGTLQPTDAHFLLLLYGLEYLATLLLRQAFRRSHGG